MNFQVTVLKILVSYPDGFAVMADLKCDMAILATSGRDWAQRTKRLASRVPDLDIFSQGLVERLDGGWRITDKGREVLELMEARPGTAEPQQVVEVVPASPKSPPVLRSPAEAGRRRERRQRRGAAGSGPEPTRHRACRGFTGPALRGATSVAAAIQPMPSTGPSEKPLRSDAAFAVSTLSVLLGSHFSTALRAAFFQPTGVRRMYGG